MRCIEIKCSYAPLQPGCSINRNMRCIEMIMANPDSVAEFRLIETWDVLKCSYVAMVHGQSQRLIETWDVLKFLFFFCIVLIHYGLIETWDVLKCLEESVYTAESDRLIETWDVLK